MWTKEQNNEYNRLWREKNKERAKEIRKKSYLKNIDKKREYALKNKEKKREYDKVYHEKNRSKRLARNKEVYNKNRDAELVRMKIYRENNKEKMAKYKKEWIAKNPKDWRVKTFKHRYGITLEEYEKMFASQKGCCAICGSHQSELKKSLHIDHCHESKKIRGLLCQKCNSFLGLAHDNVDLLKSAIKYLTCTSERFF